jgi:hypothetical protein
MQTKPTSVEWAGIVLILLVGAIHVYDAPSSFGDAQYKGVLFVANGVGALVAAIGIYRDVRSWGWNLGLLVAGGALVGYVISRTVGLPGMSPEEWLEPLGVLACVAEASYILVYLRASRKS